jgi:PKHD-type hydroxylase
MQYYVSPYFNGEPNYVWEDNIFNENELDYIQCITKLAKEAARIKGGGLVNSVRRTNIDWLEYSDKDSWIFKKLSNVVEKINAQFYHFDITCIREPMQLTNYNSEDLGTYDWHVDRGPGPTRKLSLVLQLSNPEDYVGGELHLLCNPESTLINKKRGLIVVFPSYVLHKVTPVTSGTRQTLVTWFSGPNFR